MNKTFDGLIVSLTTVVIMRLWFAVWGAVAIRSEGSGIATDLLAFSQTLIRDPSEVLRLFLTPWQRWDANWYLRIAEFGYSPDDASSAFFPLFPLLIRSAASLLGQNYLLANLVICTIAAFGAFVFLYLVSVDL